MRVPVAVPPAVAAQPVPVEAAHVQPIAVGAQGVGTGVDVRELTVSRLGLAGKQDAREDRRLPEVHHMVLRQVVVLAEPLPELLLLGNGLAGRAGYQLGDAEDDRVLRRLVVFERPVLQVAEVLVARSCEGRVLLEGEAGLDPPADRAIVAQDTGDRAPGRDHAHRAFTLPVGFLHEAVDRLRVRHDDEEGVLHLLPREFLGESLGLRDARDERFPCGIRESVAQVGDRVETDHATCSFPLRGNAPGRKARRGV